MPVDSNSEARLENISETASCFLPPASYPLPPASCLHIRTRHALAVVQLGQSRRVPRRGVAVAVAGISQTVNPRRVALRTGGVQAARVRAASGTDGELRAEDQAGAWRLIKRLRDQPAEIVSAGP